MKKNLVKISMILCVVIFSGISFASCARIYLEPQVTSFVSNCPSTIDVIVDSEGEDVVAGEFVLFFNSGEIQPLSFDYGKVFQGGGLMQKTTNDRLRVLGFGLADFKGKGVLGKLSFQSIGDTKQTKLGFKSPEGRVYSTLSTKGGKNVLYDVYDGTYSFYDGECPFSLSVSSGTNVVEDINFINEQYIKQMKNMVSKWERHKLYTKILYYSISLIIIIVIIYLLFKSNLFSKFSKGKKEN